MFFVAIFLCIEPMVLGFLKCDIKSADRFYCMQTFSLIKTNYSYKEGQLFATIGIIMSFLYLYRFFGFIAIEAFVSCSIHWDLE